MARINDGTGAGSARGKLPTFVRAAPAKVPGMLARNYVTPDKKAVPDLLARPKAASANPWGLPQGGRLAQEQAQNKVGRSTLPAYRTPTNRQYEREDRQMMAQRAAQRVMNDVAYKVPYTDWTKYSPGVSASGTIGPNTATNAIAPVGWEDQYLPRWNQNTTRAAAQPAAPATDWRTKWADVMATQWPTYGPPAPEVGPWVPQGGGGGGGYADEGGGYGGYGGGGGGGYDNSKQSWLDMYQWRF